ncbi:uncharacterized protein LOC114310374 [Camellia sinensis]|uniref:uncharacterized protein LOC114310374 n=1 Tax=Camellia sinensis TaxID=4442 RepID=UPI00103660DF|nr:uncharacterized protein LOC114310374 [Camellia sinensis]
MNTIVNSIKGDPVLIKALHIRRSRQAESFQCREKTNTAMGCLDTSRGGKLLHCIAGGNVGHLHKLQGIESSSQHLIFLDLYMSAHMQSYYTSKLLLGSIQPLTLCSK